MSPLFALGLRKRQNLAAQAVVNCQRVDFGVVTTVAKNRPNATGAIADCIATMCGRDPLVDNHVTKKFLPSADVPLSWR